MGTPRGLVTAGTLEFPQAEKRSIRPQLWASRPGLQVLGQSGAYSYAGTSSLPPPQGKTPEPAGRNSCHKGTMSVLCTCPVPAISQGASR